MPRPSVGRRNRRQVDLSLPPSSAPVIYPMAVYDMDVTSLKVSPVTFDGTAFVPVDDWLIEGLPNWFMNPGGGAFITAVTKAGAPGAMYFETTWSDVFTSAERLIAAPMTEALRGPNGEWLGGGVFAQALNNKMTVYAQGATIDGGDLLLAWSKNASDIPLDLSVIALPAITVNGIAATGWSLEPDGKTLRLEFAVPVVSGDVVDIPAALGSIESNNGDTTTAQNFPVG